MTEPSKRGGLALVAFAFLVNMLGTTLPTPLYPLYERELHVGGPIVTVIFALYAIAVVAGLLLFGHQSDRVGRRKTLLLGLALSGLSAICFLLAHDVIAVYAGRVLSGVSAGIFTGAATAAMVDYAGEGRRRAISLLAVVVNVGGLGVGTLLSGALAQFAPLPLRLPYAADLVLVVLAICAVAASPETVENARGRFTFSLQSLRVPDEIRGIFIRASVAGVCAFAVSGLFSAVAPVFLAAQLHVRAPAIAGALVFLLMGSSAAGQLLVEHIPKRVAFLSGCIVLAAAMALLAGAIAGASAVSASLALLFAAAFTAGVGQGIVMGFGLANINERIAQRRGQVVSAYFVLVYLGLALPVVAVGFAAAAFGLSLTGLVFCGATAVIVLAAGASDVLAARAGLHAA